MDFRTPRLPFTLDTEEYRLTQAGLVFLTQVGSRLHGIEVEGTDDDDEMGLCIEPPEYLIGLQHFEQYQWRTQPEGVRSGPGDLDLVVYSLRKWMRLALAGNPTVLLVLFTPKPIFSHPVADELRDNAHRFRSREAGRRFLGYMNGQRQKMVGERASHTNRPELIEQYGYDTKFAGHMIRLGLQGIEFLSTGRITLPMKPADAALIKAIRAGEYGEQDVLAMEEGLESTLMGYMKNADIPDKANYDWANAWLVMSYTDFWIKHS